jgi:hypothetical protein
VPSGKLRSDRYFRESLQVFGVGLELGLGVSVLGTVAFVAGVGELCGEGLGVVVALAVRVTEGVGVSIEIFKSTVGVIFGP